MGLGILSENTISAAMVSFIKAEQGLMTLKFIVMYIMCQSERIIIRYKIRFIILNLPIKSTMTVFLKAQITTSIFNTGHKNLTGAGQLVHARVPVLF